MLRPPVEPAAPQQRAVYFPDAGWVDTPVLRRAALASGATVEGPAVIQEAGSTTLLPPGDRLQVDDRGILLISLDGATTGPRE